MHEQSFSAEVHHLQSSQQSTTTDKLKLMPLYQHFVSTQNTIKRNTVIEQLQSTYSISVARQFSYNLMGCNVVLIDLIATVAVIVFIIGIDHRLNPVDLSVVRIDIYNRIRYNWDCMNRLTEIRNVYGIFNGIAFVTTSRILIEISTLSLLSRALSIIFDDNIPHLNTQSKIEFVYNNNSNATIIISNFYKINGAAIVLGFFSIDIYFMQAIDGSLNAMLSIELGANIAVFAQLIFYLTVQLSISVNYCYNQVMLINGTPSIEHQFLCGDFLLTLLFLSENVTNVNVLFPLISRNENEICQ